ncbi:ABC transporter permease subunit [Plantactinospora sp. KLBMP9567]|uniref:ABC transporter permease subunit n=1 Tax=Plantactinospora sp. KLBMP9567 TaxID=3085900 RepID=UPI0029812916|nr:ABC transporter permease subunit [Plantactinospora sp. KLBMP9567]MDW5325418.1 ABC transporter permease subunit [Plantactinospora sp. KLBMP9567]
MNLYTTELRRLAKRRFVRYLTLAGLLVLVAVAVGMFFTNQKIGPAQVAQAERAADQEYQQNVAMTEQHRKECERAKAAGDTSTDRFPEECASIQPPPREVFRADWHLPATFEFRDEFASTITTLTAVLALVAFVGGASFVGAEWSTGGMMNLLLWRPQRIRVLLTKLGALLSALFGVTVLTGALWTAAFWATGSLRGSTAGMTSGAWQSFGLTGLRGLVLILVAGVLGFGLASLGRHTALALGGVLGVMVVGQFGLGIVLAMAQVRFIESWLLPTYLLAWMDKKVTLENWDACQASFSGECHPLTKDITWQNSSVLLAVGLVVVLGGAIWSMRRRDIT